MTTPRLTTRFARPAGMIAALTILGSSQHASAFDFGEHAYMTRIALRLSLETEAGAPAGAKQSIDLLADAERVLDHNFCKVKDALEKKPEELEQCFTIADVPALAGDHAGSPLLLKWRWFDEIHPRPESPVHEIEDVFRTLGKLGLTRCAPPENAMTKPPGKADAFLNVVQPWESPTKWPEPGPEKVDPEDSSYGTLASNNCNHFRDPIEFSPGWIAGGTRAARHELSTARSRYHLRGDTPDLPFRSKPDLSSYAWYADLHVGALQFLRAARAAGLDPEVQAKLRGVAVVLELFSLHFSRIRSPQDTRSRTRITSRRCRERTFTAS